MTFFPHIVVNNLENLCNTLLMINFYKMAPKAGQHLFAIVASIKLETKKIIFRILESCFIYFSELLPGMLHLLFICLFIRCLSEKNGHISLSFSNQMRYIVILSNLVHFF